MSNSFTPVSDQFPGGVVEDAEHAGDGGFASAIGTLGRIANGIAVVFTLALAAVFVYEIVARFVFNHPTGFANQLAAYGMPFIAYLAAARTLARNGHVSVDFFVIKLRPAARTKLELATDAFSVALLAFVTYIAAAAVFETWQTGYRAFSTSFTFPEFLPQLVMPIGLLLLTLEQAVRVLTGWRNLSSEAARAKEAAR